MNEDIIKKIENIKDAVPKKQRQLCNYIILNPENVALFTIAELANSAGTGTTTVMRLVNLLGFDSYSEFKKAIANTVFFSKTSFFSNRIKGQNDEYSYDDEIGSLHKIVQDSSYILESMNSRQNSDAIDKAVLLIKESRRVYTLGLRSSIAFATYFDINAGLFFPNIVQLSDKPDSLFDMAISNITKEDVILLWSVWPCTTKVIDFAEFCHKRGIKLILITNTSVNPIYKIADVSIETGSANHISGGTSLFAVTETLILELSKQTRPLSSQNMKEIEETLSEMNIISK